jgi:hypothetical protein
LFYEPAQFEVVAPAAPEGEVDGNLGAGKFCIH